MASGFAPYILRDWASLAQINYPGTQVTPAGFLEMLLQNTDVAGVKLVENNGHQVTGKVKYKQRAQINTVQEQDNCDIDIIPAYQEADITAVRIAKHGIYFSRETISKYMAEASQVRTIGTPPKGILREIVDQINFSANAIISRIDQRLLGDVNWGKNVVYGDDAIHDLNINKDASALTLESGYTKLLNDAFENEFMGTLNIVGSGLMNMVELGRAAGALGLANNGVDISRFTGYKWYPDIHAKSVANWGGNDIGVFAQGAIHFVDFDKYKGFRTGPLANSFYFRIPIMVGGQVMMFDAQLREIDCPTSIVDIYGASASYSEGYQLILKKTYGLFQLPDDAYASGDRLTGVNGAIHYNVTNTCESC